MDWQYLIAEADGQPVSLVAAIVAVLMAVVGLLVWLVKRLIDHTLPDQQKVFQEELKAARDSYSESIKAAWAAHSSQIAVDREFHKEQMAEDRKFFTELLGTLIGDTRKAHTEELTELKRLAETILTATSAIRENQLGIEAAVKVSEEHFEHWQTMAMEWRELNVEARRKLRGRADPIPPLPGGKTT